MRPCTWTPHPLRKPEPRSCTVRPYWKGYLKLALVSCPIALHAACSTAERIAFRQINKVTGNRLRQQLIDEETHEPVARLNFLERLARQGGPRRRQLKPGTVFVRQYQGQRHAVTVGRDGFLWQGATYSSLSAIARAITGTAWSGPRFFALQGAGDARQPKRKSAAGQNMANLVARRRVAAIARKSATTVNHALVHLDTTSPA